MKKLNMRVILISCISLLLIPAAIFYTDYATSHQPETVEIKAEIVLPKVTVVNVEIGSHASAFSVFGEVESADNLTLLSQASGRVVWLSPSLSTGKTVAKGELLLRLEDSNYRVALANAKKQLADADLLLQQEKRKFQRAQDDWKRSGVTLTPTDLVLRKPQLAISIAQYNAAKEQVAYAKVNLSHTQIYAPFDAVITNKQVSIGSYLSEASPVGAMQSISTAEINLSLSEQEWQQLPQTVKGMRVVVESSIPPQQQWTGVVDKLAWMIDKKNRTRLLTVVVDKPLEQAEPLLFGHFVKVHLRGESQANSFSIPSSAITADGYIWLEQNQSLFKHKVHPLFNSDKFVGIQRDDLPPSFNLVRKPLSKYVVGMRVVSALEEANNEG